MATKKVPHKRARDLKAGDTIKLRSHASGALEEITLTDVRHVPGTDTFELEFRAPAAPDFLKTIANPKAKTKCEKEGIRCLHRARGSDWLSYLPKPPAKKKK